MVNADILERYLKDTPQRRMGNLGSELLRLSNAVQRGNLPAAHELMELSLSYIEVGGMDFPDDTAELLAKLQRVLLAHGRCLDETINNSTRRLQFNRELEIYSELTIRLMGEC